MTRYLLCLLLLVPYAVARAEDEDQVEVWIVRHVEALPLAQVVEETAAHAGLHVEVEPALGRKKVTVVLDDPVVGAIQRLATAAGGHLWKLGAGRYAVRRKPPPASSVPPRAELEGYEPNDDEKPPPEPAWERAIWKALDSTPFEGVFRKTPLPAFLAAVGKQAGVPVHLDPAVVRGRSKQDLLVDFEDPLGDSSVRDALLMFCGTRDLTHTTRWGVLYFSTPARLRTMPDDVLVGGVGELPEATRAALASQRVTAELKKASLAKAVQLLTRDADVRIVVDPVVVKHCGRRRFTMAFQQRRLGDALALLLVPAGLALREQGGALHVIVREP